MAGTRSRHRRLRERAPETFLLIVLTIIVTACSDRNDAGDEVVRLIQLDPGHFHAGLVQKTMYEGIDPGVHVYAPAGPELDDFLLRIDGYNSRSEHPTGWEMTVYRGADYLERMLAERAGNLLVTAGNNARKTEYIHRAVSAGLNVLADKPMAITPGAFPLLVEAFGIAGEQGVLLYDIMTERFEITNLLQRELSMIPVLFGTLEPGSPEEPAITKESVHHLFKHVSGTPLVRPGWFFDVSQEGTGLADVGTHLVDLIQWECFPGEIIDHESEIEMLSARGWTTDLEPEQFTRVTGLSAFPEFLDPWIEDGILRYPCNGSMTWRIRGITARVSVTWAFQAPEGTGDTHYSIMRGTGCDLVIRQGEAEGFRPTLYIETQQGGDTFEAIIELALKERITPVWPGVEAVKLSDGIWRVEIPDLYRIGHEAHFGQVVEAYLGYLEAGALPDWEVPNMIAKYHTTTAAVGMISGR